MKNLITLVCAVSTLMCIGLGCGRLDFTTDGKIYFEEDGAQKAAAAIRDEIGKPFNVTEVFIDESGAFKVQAQDPDNPKNLDEYKYIRGFVTGPNPVKLDGMNENLQSSSFPFDEINFAAIPEFAREAIEKAGIEEAEIYRMTFQRGFAMTETGMGSLGNAYWKIEIRGIRENVTATADPNGKLLGVDLSSTSQAREYRLLTKEKLQKAQDELRNVISADRQVSRIVLDDKMLHCKIVNLENPEVRDLYQYDINGITKRELSKILTIEIPGMSATYSLSDVDLADAVTLVEKAKTRVEMPDAAVSNITIERTSASFNSKEFRISWNISLKKGLNDGSVIYDNEGKEIRASKMAKPFPIINKYEKFSNNFLRRFAFDICRFGLQKQSAGEIYKSIPLHN